MDNRSIICQNSVGMVQFPMKHVDNIVRRGLMFISDSLPFVKSYIEELDNAIKQYDAKAKLSKAQKMWLSFCIMAIFITRTVCWKKFERAGLGRKSGATISWMFRKAAIPWPILLTVSTLIIIKRFGITRGRLAIDETDKKRSKAANMIYKLHKIKDKASGGYINGQKLVFLFFITDLVSFPVGFEFYAPDPVLKQWKKNDETLRKKKVAKKYRPPEPARNANYPTIAEIALSLLRQFRIEHPSIKIDCILADALYGTQAFLDEASRIFDGVQVISQIKKDQNVTFRGRNITVEKYFSINSGVTQKIKIRLGKQEDVTVASARLHVCAHGKKRFVIALKYKGEKDYRYIVATDLSWRTLDIVEAYTLRWLIEVFFEDWKISEGWGRLTKHTGETGSRRGVILSLLTDHCLFFHPDQQAFIEDNLAACTVGSLIRQIRIECFVQFVRDMVIGEEQNRKLDKLTETFKNEIYQLMPSSKHMSGKKMERLEPSPSLKYKKAA
jgi:hypothetical protein